MRAVIGKWFLLSIIIGAIVLVGLKRHESKEPRLLSETSLGSLELKANQFHFKLRTSNQEWVSSYDLYTAPTLLIFSASWCLSNNELFTSIETIKEQVGQDKINFLFLSLDRDPNETMVYLKARNIAWPVLLVPETLLNRHADVIKGVPTMILVDQTGTVLEKIEGYLNVEQIVGKILGSNTSKGN